jgi:hypothetical protein
VLDLPLKCCEEVVADVYLRHRGTHQRALGPAAQETQQTQQQGHQVSTVRCVPHAEVLAAVVRQSSGVQQQHLVQRHPLPVVLQLAVRDVQPF